MDYPKLLEAEACGNKFLIRELALGETIALLQDQVISKLIQSGRDSGLLLEKVGSDVWEMHVLEKDGSLSSFCGNGARAVALYLKKRYSLESAYLVNRKGERCHLMCKTDFPSVAIESVHVENGLCFVLGEPHAIYEKPLDCIEDLAKQHSNVNVSCIQPISENCWNIVTWERGVNGTTLSCGSGCVAAMHAIITKFGISSGEIVFLCPGGENRVVYREGFYILSGPASIEACF